MRLFIRLIGILIAVSTLPHSQAGAVPSTSLTSLDGVKLVVLSAKVKTNNITGSDNSGVLKFRKYPNSFETDVIFKSLRESYRTKAARRTELAEKLKGLQDANRPLTDQDLVATVDEMARLNQSMKALLSDPTTTLFDFNCSTEEDYIILGEVMPNFNGISLSFEGDGANITNITSTRLQMGCGENDVLFKYSPKLGMKVVVEILPSSVYVFQSKQMVAQCRTTIVRKKLWFLDETFGSPVGRNLICELPENQGSFHFSVIE